LDLPRHVGLLTLIGCQDLSTETIADRWNSHARGLACAIGRSRRGVFAVDLTRDGPHALVTGTTGSGKSELLRSLLIGLSLTYSPDRLQFVLIDYKGGSGLAECAKLPHSCELLTDLDSSTASRALASLQAELRRRERAFADANISEYEEYENHSREDVAL